MRLLQVRAPQAQEGTSMLPDIPAQGAGGGNLAMPSPTSAGAGGNLPILAQTTPLVITTTATTSTAPTTVSAGPASSSAAPSPSHTIKGATVIAIVVPIIALLLMIPLIFFLYRSHRMKKNAHKRSSQRTSREAMLSDEKATSMHHSNSNSAPSSTSKGFSATTTTTPVVAALPPQLPPPRPRRSPSSNAKQIRPSNSLGLFNFDLDSPATSNNTSRAPTTPNSPPRLSVARTLQLRRSDVSVVNNSRNGKDSNGPSPYLTQGVNPLRNNPSTTVHAVSEPPPPPYQTAPDPAPQSPPQQSHFAPLNQIGTAITHPTRTKHGQSGTSTPRMMPDHSSEESVHAGAVPWPVPPSRQYSVSDYGHDSLGATLPTPPVAAARPSPRPTSRDRQPDHPDVSPIDTHQSMGFGLGMSGRFSLSPHERRRRSEEGRSDVSGLSFDPDWLTDDHRDGRRHSGRVSPVDSDDMTRTRSIL